MTIIDTPETGPFRGLLKHFSPAWVIRHYGERLTQGTIGLVADAIAEANTAALTAPLLAEEESPADAVVKKSAERVVDRYPTDTNVTHRARTLDAWGVWCHAGTEPAILNQIYLFGYTNTYLLGIDDVDFPRRFFVVSTVEGMVDVPTPAALADEMFLIANKFRAAEERVHDVTVLSRGRTFGIHPLTGLPHTFGDWGPGINTYGDSSGAQYRELVLAGWWVSEGVYSGKSLDVSTQETESRGMALSSDGTKAYVVGSAGDAIFQYTLSTAWDISSGSYASKSLDLSNEETTPRAIALSSDGTKAYVVGESNDTIYQYTLSTAWDISSGSYASKSLDVSSRGETSPTGLAFKSDGTKVYVIGPVKDTVFQYTLSTAWDISTGKYEKDGFDVSSKSTAPRGLAFSVDGTMAYVVSANDDKIYQYYTYRVVYD